MDYIEKDPGLGVSYTWHNCQMVHQEVTHRGTRLELVHRPSWGLTCYMDGVIQSCELDEELYHRSFVNAVFKGLRSAQRVCIFGGGEGALARTVMASPAVQQADMYEWDMDVVQAFQRLGQSWSRGAWTNPKLRLFYRDAFSIQAAEHPLRYEAVFIDLFDLDESTIESWIPFLKNAAAWCNGHLGLYVTTQAPFSDLKAPVLQSAYVLNTNADKTRSDCSNSVTDCRP